MKKHLWVTACLSNAASKNVIFTDVLLAGAQFRECTLENVVFERVIASIAGMAPEKMDDWYRALSMLLTSMEHVRFSDCDLRGGQMEQCTTTYTVMENTLAEASDFRHPFAKYLGVNKLCSPTSD